MERSRQDQETGTRRRCTATGACEWVGGDLVNESTRAGKANANALELLIVLACYVFSSTGACPIFFLYLRLDVPWDTSDRGRQ